MTQQNENIQENETRTENITAPLDSETIEPLETIETEETPTPFDEILCDDCFLPINSGIRCKSCESIRKKGTLPIKPIIKNVSLTSPNRPSASLRQLTIAPLSVRYDGKELDAIAWSMLPALPETMILEIRQLVAVSARSIVGENPSIQDIDAMAEYHVQLGAILRQLSIREKDKITLTARPEAKRREIERKITEKAEKIAKTLPVDANLKHAANILLDGKLTFLAPLIAAHKPILKKFLDYVSLMAQVEESIDTAWITKTLATPQYSYLRQYVRIEPAK